MRDVALREGFQAKSRKRNPVMRGRLTLGILSGKSLLDYLRRPRQLFRRDFPHCEKGSITLLPTWKLHPFPPLLWVKPFPFDIFSTFLFFVEQLATPFTWPPRKIQSSMVVDQGWIAQMECIPMGFNLLHCSCFNLLSALASLHIFWMFVYWKWKIYRIPKNLSHCKGFLWGFRIGCRIKRNTTSATPQKSIFPNNYEGCFYRKRTVEEIRVSGCQGRFVDIKGP